VFIGGIFEVAPGRETDLLDLLDRASSVHGRSRGNVGEVFVARRMATEREERATTGRGPPDLADVAGDLGEALRRAAR
jgi:hypothetical protein